MTKPKKKDISNIIKHEFKVQTDAGVAKLMLMQRGRVFDVIRFEVMENPEISIGFKIKGVVVENMDESSEIWESFKISTKVRFNDVILSATQMRATCIEELMYVLQRVSLATYDHAMA